MITFQTNFGPIVIELDHENTPITSANFLALAKSGHFQGTIFHRVINNFMIQGGGFLPGMIQKPRTDAIDNEADKGQKNKRGTIAMARTSDPHSASSQFFINVVDNASLDHTSKTPNGWGYCVFGKVIQGMDVVDKIKTAKTGSRAGHEDVPVDDIVVEAVTITETA